MNLVTDLPLIYPYYPQSDDSPHNVVIEIPSGSNCKYEYDRGNSCLTLRRLLRYPLPTYFSYGFLPKTLAEDGDALDAVLLSGGHIIQPLAVVPSFIVGVLLMKDKNSSDHKILVSPAALPITEFSHIQDYILKPYESYIRGNKNYEGVKFEIFGWKGKREAMKIIKQAKDNFRNGHL